MKKRYGHSAMSPLPKLLTETQVSMIFNVSINTLRYWRHCGMVRITSKWASWCGIMRLSWNHMSSVKPACQRLERLRRYTVSLSS